MFQQGQVFRVRTRGSNESQRWAYRYRVGGRGSKRVQRGGFKSEQAAIEALERALERLQRERGLVEAPPLRELVEIYLAQHDGEPRRSRNCAGCSRKQSARSVIAGSAIYVRPKSRRGE